MPPKRRLGRSGLATAPLILGGDVFGWTADEAASFAVLDAFVAGGGTMIDTADTYSAWAPGNRGGESETIIGRWLARRGRRDDVLIATKAGFAEGLGAAAIERAIDGSLKRLGTDRIDLYLAHRDDPEVPIEETLEAFDRLVRAGKVRALGASNFTAERLELALDVSAANGWTGFSVLQTRYNLLERADYEAELSGAVARRRLAATAYSALAYGYLTGKYRSRADLARSVRGERVRDYLGGGGPEVLAALDGVAAQIGATPAQVALAWTTAQPGIAAALVSATGSAQIEELLGSFEIALDPAQRALIDEASRPGAGAAGGASRG